MSPGPLPHLAAPIAVHGLRKAARGCSDAADAGCRERTAPLVKNAAVGPGWDFRVFTASRNCLARVGRP